MSCSDGSFCGSMKASRRTSSMRNPKLRVQATRGTIRQWRVALSANSNPQSQGPMGSDQEPSQWQARRQAYSNRREIDLQNSSFISTREDHPKQHGRRIPAAADIRFVGVGTLNRLIASRIGAIGAHARVCFSAITQDIAYRLSTGRGASRIGVI